MEQYRDAALRHYRDAIALREINALDNAGHLIGFSAECAIKYAIGYEAPEDAKRHFPQILSAVRKYINKRSSVYNLLQQNLLSGWRVSRRYLATGHTSIAEFDMWKRDTKRIFAAVGIKERI